jgi:fibronectin type 3 domain-containing protein
MKKLHYAALLLVAASSAIAQTPTPTPPIVSSLKVAWDPSPDPNTTKYNLYISTTAPAGAPPKFANPTAFQIVAPTVNYTFTNLLDGKYWLAVTAANGANLESPYSNVIQATVISTTPPAPTGLRITSVTTAAAKTAAKVNWATDGPSKGKVALYDKQGRVIDTQGDSTVGTTHSVKFTGLKKNKTYGYQVSVKTPTGEAGPVSPMGHFTLSP